MMPQIRNARRPQLPEARLDGRAVLVPQRHRRVLEEGAVAGLAFLQGEPGVPLRGDVAHERGHDGPLGTLDDGAAHVQIDDAPVTGAVTGGKARAAGREHRRDPVIDLLRSQHCFPVTDVRAHELLDRVARKRAVGRIHIQDRAAAVGQDEAVERGLEEAPGQVGLPRPRPLGLHPVRDVHEGALHRGPPCPEDPAGCHFEPPYRPVGGPGPHRPQSAAASTLQAAPEPCEELLPVVLVNEGGHVRGSEAQ